MQVNNDGKPTKLSSFELEQVKAQVTAVAVSIEATDVLLREAVHSEAPFSKLECEVKQIEANYKYSLVIGALTTAVGAGYLAMKGVLWWQSVQQTIKKR